jgi:RNA exonuclease 1
VPQAIISSITALKRRPRPDSPRHASVGTNAELLAREETKASFAALTLTRAHLAPLVLSADALAAWGYVVAAPPGPGGTHVSEAGKAQRCERCGTHFEVAPADTAQACVHHHGKIRSVQMDGARRAAPCAPC